MTKVADVRALTEEDEALLYSIIWNLIQVADTNKLGVGLQDWVSTFTEEVDNDDEHEYHDQLTNYSNDLLDLALATYKGKLH